MGKDTISLVIMAAGMGSRYGGLKQLDPVGKNGELLIHYTLFDAKKVGFERVVFVIRHEFEEKFKEEITEKGPRDIEVAYAYQDVADLPAGREKPWGTGHAILVCKDLIGGPFGVVNADDYYGRGSLATLFQFLASDRLDEKTYGMVSYRLKNTVSPHGAVTRGICCVDDSGWLVGIEETRGIELRGEEIGVEKNGRWSALDPMTPTSMNIWGFHRDIFTRLDDGFLSFLGDNKNDPKAEFLIPEFIGSLVSDGEIRVQALDTDDVWFGMTHPEDKEIVRGEIEKMIRKGVYPDTLR
jgi:NDP-sugar pyrophosphorylase family protein